MGRLIYTAITSLDGYVTDASGGFAWAEPDEEVHAFFNDLERPIGTYLYGRRMYETMVVWETMRTEEGVIRDFAEIWRAAEKIVFSASLEGVSSARTHIRRTFDPDEVRRHKDSYDWDMSVGGADLAGQALRARLVDECHLIVVPVMVGGGTRAMPEGVQTSFELTDERRFQNGMVHLGYHVQ